MCRMLKWKMHDRWVTEIPLGTIITFTLSMLNAAIMRQGRHGTLVRLLRHLVNLLHIRYSSALHALIAHRAHVYYAISSC